MVLLSCTTLACRRLQYQVIVLYDSTFYSAMLRRVRLCDSKSSICLSLHLHRCWFYFPGTMLACCQSQYQVIVLYDSTYLSNFYSAMLHRVQLCDSKSSVRMSLSLSVTPMVLLSCTTLACCRLQYQVMYYMTYLLEYLMYCPVTMQL